MVACLVHVPFLSTMRVYGKHCKPQICLLNIRLCLHIQKRFFVYDIYKYEKIIRLDALVSMRDINDPLFIENARKYRYFL